MPTNCNLRTSRTPKAQPTLSILSLQPKNTTHVSYDFKNCRLDSPIPWDELIGEYSFSDSEGSEYVPDEASKTEDGDERERSYARDDDTKTSYKEWATIEARVHEFQMQKNEAPKTRTTETQPAAITCGMENEYKNFERKMDNPIESGDEGTKLQRKIERVVRVGVNIDVKKFKWQVGQTFGTVAKFKYAIVRFALTQGFDLKIGVYDSARKRIVAMCTKSCKFKIYVSWDKEKATYVVRTVIDNHNVEETY